MGSAMKTESDMSDPQQRFKQGIIKAAVIGTAIWTGFFFLFLVINLVFPTMIPEEGWFLAMIKQQPAATIGIGMSAISAFCLVTVLEYARGPIEFEFWKFKFRGASGPVVLWIMCFLAMILGVYLLWV